VLVEAYSVLTRLPSGLAVPASVAADVLDRRFPDAPLQIESGERRSVLATLAGVGVLGGAAYSSGT
jgi:hypothetical protein